MMSEFEREKSTKMLGFQRFMRLALVTELGEVGQVVSVVVLINLILGRLFSLVLAVFESQ